MNTKLEKYLDAVDRHLRPLPTSERVDVVKEIKGSMMEMEQDDISAEEILERLGPPKDLAKAYLGDLLAKESGFSLNRFLVACAFYSVVGLSGMIIIPTLAVVAPTFIFVGILSPIVVGVKMVDYIFHLGIPYIENVGVFSVNGVSVMNPIFEFLVALVVGICLCLLGKGAWKLLKYYCVKVGRTKRDLSV